MWDKVNSSVYPPTYDNLPIYCQGCPVSVDADGYLYVVGSSGAIHYLCTGIGQYIPGNPQSAPEVYLGNWGNCWVVTDGDGAQATLEVVSEEETTAYPGDLNSAFAVASGGMNDISSVNSDRLARLTEIGSAAGSNEEAALLADIAPVMASVENLFYPHLVLTGVVFLNRVAAQAQAWRSEGVSSRDLRDLLCAGLAAQGTTMKIDQLPEGDIQAYLSLGYTILCDTWSGLGADDRVAFVSENMNTDKYNYGRAIESLGKPPRRKMGTGDILMDHMFSMSNTKKFGAFESGSPSTHFDQIEAELKSTTDPAALRVAIRSSFVQLLGAMWSSYHAKFKGQRDALHLDRFVELIWPDMDAIVESFPEGARLLVWEICREEGGVRSLLDETLMLWEDDGSFGSNLL